MVWHDPIRNVYNQVKNKAAAARDRTRTQHFSGQVDAHNVDIGRRGNRVSQVHIDGERFVKDRRRYRDLSTGGKIFLGGAYTTRVGVAGGATYPLRQIGESLDSLIMAAVSGVKAPIEVAKEAANLVGNIFNTSERGALRNIESLMQQGSFDSGTYSTAESYLTNFAGYKATHVIIDKARAGIEKNMADAAGAAKKAPFTSLPTDSLYEKLHNLILEQRGINESDPRYAENNLKVLQLRKDVYDTLDDSARNVTNEMSKPSPNLGYSVEQMQRFNKDYETLLKEEAEIRAGVENANPAQLIAMQRQIDEIKPAQTGWVEPYLGVILPILGGYMAWRAVSKILVKPLQRVFYTGSN